MLTDKEDQGQKQRQDDNVAVAVEGGGSGSGSGGRGSGAGAGRGGTAGGDAFAATAAGPPEAKAKRAKTAAANEEDEEDDDDDDKDRVQSILQKYSTNDQSQKKKIAVAGCQHVHRLLFTKMRSVATTSPEFVVAANRSMTLLAEDALAYFPSYKQTITTPCGQYRDGYVSVIDNNGNTESFLTAVSIVRSGDALLEVVRRLDPNIKVGKILIQRDESTEEKHAVLKYHKLPHDVHQGYVLLCDPMLATGGSAIKALEVLVEQYNVPPSKIIFANMISCPEGLEAVLTKFPSLLKIVTVVIDPGLNDQKYIVPGLGDYGDRYYNT